MANKEARKTTVEKPKRISKAEKIQHDTDNSTLFCIGDDDYKDNVFYVIGTRTEHSQDGDTRK